MKEKRAEKRKKVYVKSYGRLSIFLLLLLVLAVVLLVNSSIFEISSINVMGNSRFSVQEIIESSGVAVGDNIFKLSEADIKERLENNPYISVIDIVREFPDKITIYISEREAAVQFEYAGVYCNADYDGVVLAATQTHDPALMLVKGLNLTGYKLGERIAVQDETLFSDYLELIKQLKGYSLIDQVSQADFSDSMDLKLTMDNGLTVKLGSIVQLADKLAYYSPAVDSLEKNGYADAMGQIKGVLDLSVMDNFAFMPSQEENANGDASQGAGENTGEDAGGNAGESGSGDAGGTTGGNADESGDGDTGGTAGGSTGG